MNISSFIHTFNKNVETLIQKGERWKVTLLKLRSPLKCSNKIILLSKDHGLMSRTSTMSSSFAKIVKNRLFPTSLIVTHYECLQSCWMVDLNGSLLKYLLICNLKRRLNWACCLERATSWELIARTPFSSSKRWNFFQSSFIAASVIGTKIR